MGTNVFPGGNTNQPIVDALLGMQSVANAVTARAGGTQALATPLTAAFNRISVCATAADSVALPLAVAGLEIAIANDGAASAQVFGAGTDTINSVATATGVAQANTARAVYKCMTSAPAGNWVKY